MSEIFNRVSTVGDSCEAGQTEFQLTADAAFSKGDVVLCTLGSDGSYTTCTAPTTASLGAPSSSIAKNGTFGVILEDVASGGLARVCVRGEVSVSVISTTNASYAADQHMIPTTAKKLEIDLGNSDTNKKLVGMATAGISTVAVTGATYTESSKTITKTGGFASYALATGDVFYVSGGTGATVGSYLVATRVSDDAITLTTSIGAGADGQTNIAGNVGQSGAAILRKVLFSGREGFGRHGGSSS